MKNRILGALTAVCFCGFGYAQSEEHKWNIGIHGGAYQYNGELGNGFYNFHQAYYGLAGISVSRYLSRHFDATILGTRGESGYVRKSDVADDGAPNHFLERLTTVNAMLRYFPLGRTRYVQPYLTGGLGVIFQRGLSSTTYHNKKPFDFSMPALGAGVQFPIGSIVAVQLQETFIYTSADEVDWRAGGLNDQELLHTIGVTFNLAKFWKKSETNGGNGKNVDKCTKMPKELQAKKASRKEARKAKRTDRRKSKRR